MNPGTVLLGAGVDLELTPQIRLSFNANYLAFATTQVLEVARHQQGIDKSIGVDLSAALILPLIDISEPTRPPSTPYAVIGVKKNMSRTVTPVP